MYDQDNLIEIGNEAVKAIEASIEDMYRAMENINTHLLGMYDALPDSTINHNVKALDGLIPALDGLIIKNVRPGVLELEHEIHKLKLKLSKL